MRRIAQPLPRGAVLGAAAALIGLFALRAVAPAFSKSATLDEPYFLALGASALENGDYRFLRNKTLLSLELHAAPLVLSGADATPPAAREAGGVQAYGLRFLYGNALPPETLLARARLASTAVAAILAALVFAAADAAGGGLAGLAALLIFTLSPDMLAHAGLATEDMTVTAFAFASMLAFESYRRRPALAAAAAWGLATAGALLSKFSALFLLPTQALLLVVDSGAAKLPRRGLAAHAAAAAACAALLFFTVYGFSPAEYARAFAANTALMRQGFPTAFAGRLSERGFWYYFVGALALKTPTATLILALPALAVACASRKRLWLALPVVVLLAAASLTPFQAGVRYVLPIYPFLFVLAGLAAAELKPRSLAVSLLAVAALASFSIAPDYLAYFNEFAGGPDGGPRWLVDSNGDWGQDLAGLRDYVRRENVDAVTLSYFGAVPAGAAGFPFQNFYSFLVVGGADAVSPPSPRREILAVSATNLYGPYLVRSFGSDPLAWLRGRAPDARIGHTIMIYDAGGDASLHERLAHAFLIGGRLPQAEREARRALALDANSPWAALLGALSARPPRAGFDLLARAQSLGCGAAIAWNDVDDSARTRHWYAEGLAGLRAELRRRPDRALTRCVESLAERPQFSAP